MERSNRRTFLADVSRGMLIAGVGYGTAVELGFMRLAQPKRKPPSPSL